MKSVEMSQSFDRSRFRIVVFIAVFSVVAGTGATAFASPWTLPSDELVLTLDQHFEFADREYLPDGYYQEFPLDGQYRSQTMRVGARYGFTDRFEGQLSLDVSNVVYSADPLILDDFEEGSTSGEATERILDFNSSEFGAADLRLAGSYNLLRDDFVLTSKTTAKIPTGYDEPTGTIVTTEDGREHVGGQATLGDGQADILQTLMFGTVLPSRTFVRAEAGGIYRFGPPGHQAVADLRVGQSIGDSVVLIAGATGHLTVFEGEVIGETLIADDPTVPAHQFTRDNIRGEELRLDRDAVDVLGGIIVDVGDIEMTANYYYTVWGRNTAAVHSLTVGTILSLPEITGRSSQP